MTRSGERAGRRVVAAALCVLAASLLGVGAPAGALASTGQPPAPTGVLGTVAGSAGSGRALAVAEEPAGIASLGRGLVVADPGSNAVRVVTGSGASRLLVGAEQPGFNGDGRPAASALLDGPEAVATDAAGDVAVADTFSNRIRLVAAADCSRACALGLSSTVAGDIYTVAGDGALGYTGDGASATAAELGAPEGVAFDAGGDLLVADTENGRIRLVAATTCQEGCPFGLASTVAGDIYTIAGTGDRGVPVSGEPATSSPLPMPVGLATDPAGDLFVAVSGASEVVMVAAESCESECGFGLADTTAGDLYVLAGTGVAGAAATGVTATASELDGPAAVAVMPSGDLVVADTLGDEVLLVASATCHAGCPFRLGPLAAGDLYRVTGDGRPGFAGDGEPAVDGHLAAPSGLAVDPAGDLVVADTGNDRLRMVAASTCRTACAFGLPATTAGDLYAVAGTGVSHFSGDGGSAVGAELDAPAAVAAGPGGEVAIADAGNERIRLVAGTRCHSSCPFGLARTAAGDLYTVAGTGGTGARTAPSPGRSAPLDDPAAVAFGPDGDLVVAEAGSGTVQLLTAVTCRAHCPYGLASTRAGELYTLAGTGRGGDGASGLAARATALDDPSGLAIAPDGDLLVADTGNDVVRLLAATSCHAGCPFGLARTTAGDLYTVAGDGRLGTGGLGGPARRAELASPGGLALDAAGDLVLADTLANRVLLLAGHSCTAGCPYGLSRLVDGRLYELAGDGRLGSGGDGGPARLARFSEPRGVAVGSDGTVFVADSGNDEVQAVAALSCARDCRFGLGSTRPGDLYLVAGNGRCSVGPDGEPASARPLAVPVALATAGSGALLVVEAGNDDVRSVSSSPARGFVEVAGSGAVAPFDAPEWSAGSLPAAVVAAAALPSGGFLLATATGRVAVHGPAPGDRSFAAVHPTSPVVAVAPGPGGVGWYLATSLGAVYGVGEARSSRAPRGVSAAHPIAAMAATPSGRGYWLADADGQVYAVGDATAYRLPASSSTSPVVAMATTPGGRGYWLVRADGTVEAAGDAVGAYRGPAGGAPFVAVLGCQSRSAYRLVGRDGAVYSFGCAGDGAGRSTRSASPVVAAVVAG